MSTISPIPLRVELLNFDLATLNPFKQVVSGVIVNWNEKKCRAYVGYLGKGRIAQYVRFSDGLTSALYKLEEGEMKELDIAATKAYLSLHPRRKSFSELLAEQKKYS
jgi:hypothetical protein